MKLRPRSATSTFLTPLGLLASLCMLGMPRFVQAAEIGATVATKRVVTLAGARAAATAAEAEARKQNAGVVIAIVDDGGALVLLERLDGTQVASSEVAIGKARTAAIFRRPSAAFEEQIRAGRVAALALPGATPLQGGIPLVVDGQVVGAIGVSGESPKQDEDIARVGAAALAR
jgi:glc operon protein GlcG